MNKQLSTTELANIETSFPVIVQMTRREKIEHWVKLIAKHPRQVIMLHELEYMNVYQLANCTNIADSIFDIAANDPTFQAAGLSSNDAAAGKKFFELTKNDLHYISCDCHGQLSNEHMARRIYSL